MVTLDDLKELDRFEIFKKYIKNYILQNSDLQKIIYYPFKNPLIMEDLENPYDLFDENTALDDSGNGIHGVVLFKQKNNSILNASIPVILINFESTGLGDSVMLDSVYIIIRIIMKGTSIQELENGLYRSNVIAKMIDDGLNLERVSNIGKVKRVSYKPLELNEENEGMICIYKTQILSNRLLEEANG